MSGSEAVRGSEAVSGSEWADRAEQCYKMSGERGAERATAAEHVDSASSCVSLLAAVAARLRCSPLLRRPSAAASLLAAAL